MVEKNLSAVDLADAYVAAAGDADAYSHLTAAGYTHQDADIAPRADRDADPAGRAALQSRDLAEPPLHLQWVRPALLGVRRGACVHQLLEPGPAGGERG
jgi:hypothetical protein